MKINLGCGADYKPGWLNVDQFKDQSPDLVMDIEKTPWPIESDYADYVLLKHVLEHVGKNSETFLAIIRELYRICKPDAMVEIHVPHPQHNDFWGDPTHVRPIIPDMFQCFDLATVEQWQARGLPGTPLAIYMGVDFEVADTQFFLDPYWQEKLTRGEIDMVGVSFAARSHANVIQWIKIVLRARKPFRAGRSLDAFEEIRINRSGGLGDVVMALAAASAMSKLSKTPIVFQTARQLRPLAEQCAFLAGVITEPDEITALDAKYTAGGAFKTADLNAGTFGLSRMHQVDAYLRSGFGIQAPAALKSLRIEPPAQCARRVTERLGDLPPLPLGRLRILLHPSAIDPNRTWPQQYWQELAMRLAAEGHQIFAIGQRKQERGGMFTLEDVIDLTDAFDPLETIALMDRSDVLIATDSGPIQLAGVTDIGIVGIYSVVAGRNRLPYRHGEAAWRAIAVSPQCAFHPCYERILGSEELAAYQGSGAKTVSDNAKFLGDFCLNESRYTCMSNEITVDRVLQACHSLLAESESKPLPIGAVA